MNQQEYQKLVAALIRAAYDSGYYVAAATRFALGSPDRIERDTLRDAAILERWRLRERLLAAIAEDARYAAIFRAMKDDEMKEAT